MTACHQSFTQGQGWPQSTLPPIKSNGKGHMTPTLTKGYSNMKKLIVTMMVIAPVVAVLVIYHGAASHAPFQDGGEVEFVPPEAGATPVPGGSGHVYTGTKIEPAEPDSNPPSPNWALPGESFKEYCQRVHPGSGPTKADVVPYVESYLKEHRADILGHPERYNTFWYRLAQRASEETSSPASEPTP
jgi:hypothetical protein